MATHGPGAYDLLVIGELNADVVLVDDDPAPVFGQAERLVESGALALGGSSAIAACGAARLGLRTAFVGVVGDDALGRFLLDALRERGVDVSHAIVDPALQTGISVILSRTRGDRAILTAAGTIAALSAAHVPDELLARARHLHSAGYFLQPALQPGLPALFERARSHGATCSLDTNWDPADRWDGGVRAAIAAVDLFLPNTAELLKIAGAGTVEDALAALSRPGLAIAVKLGEEGAELHRDGEAVRAAAPAVQVVDAIGAGDSFDAGCIYGFLQGWPLERTLALAVACGSLSTRAHGGTAAQPTLAEAAA